MRKPEYSTIEREIAKRAIKLRNQLKNTPTEHTALVLNSFFNDVVNQLGISLPKTINRSKPDQEIRTGKEKMQKMRRAILSALMEKGRLTMKEIDQILQDQFGYLQKAEYVAKQDWLKEHNIVWVPGQRGPQGERGTIFFAH